MSHEAHDPDVGSVAEEAARLIGLLASELTDAEARAAGARASARTGVCETCGHDASADGTNHSGRQQDSVCRLCPVCQLVAFVRSISPDTIDRLADVVDMVSVGLRGLAESRREAAAARPPTGKATVPEGRSDQP
ncbi:MAG: hypothetical protein WCG47_28045 [Dermatophilaceae bacterium]